MTEAVDDYIRAKKRVLVHATNDTIYVGNGVTSDTFHGAMLITLKNAWIVERFNGFDSLFGDVAKEPLPTNGWVRLPGRVTVVAHAVYEVPTEPHAKPDVEVR